MTHTDTPGLLPCPFCGGDKLRSRAANAGSIKFYEIKCHECGARMRQPHRGSAVVAWNQRTLPILPELPAIEIEPYV